MSCSARLAFACRLFGSLFRTLTVLCTQQRWPRVLGHTSSRACQKPSAPSATASSGPMDSPRRLRSSSNSLQDCTLSRTPSIRPTSSFLPSGVAPMMTRRHWASAEAGLHVDAVNPDVDVTFGREIARGPPGLLARPSLLQSGDTRGGQPTRVRAEQRRQRVFKVAAGDALEVQDRDQNLEAL